MTQAGATAGPPTAAMGNPAPAGAGQPVSKKGVLAAIVCIAAGGAMGWFLAQRFGKDHGKGK